MNTTFDVDQISERGDLIREYSDISFGGSVNTPPFFDVDIDASPLSGYAVAYHSAVGSTTFNSIRVRVVDSVGAQRMSGLIDLGGEAMGVDVETLDDRSTAVIYAQPDGTNGYDLMLTRYNLFGQELQSGVNITNSAGIDETNPSASDLPNGNIALASLFDNGSNLWVQVRIIDSQGNTVVAPQLISAGSHTPADPELVALANGNFVVVWTDTSAGGVFFQVLDHSGGLVGPRRAVHEGADRAISGNHDVTPLESGGFAIGFAREDVMASTGAADDALLYSVYSGNGALVTGPIESPDMGAFSAGVFIHEYADGLIGFGRENGQVRLFGDVGSRFDDYVAPTGPVLSRLYGGSDVFDGSTGNDTVYGGAGSDQINGGDGNDLIFGGTSSPGDGFREGNQILRGGNGNDFVTAQGSSQIFGGAGSDVLLGSSEADLIDGGTSSDIIRGRGGSDEIHGGGGNDRVITGAGNSTVFGGAGNDFIQGDNEAINDAGPQGTGMNVGTEMHGGTGSDTIFGSGGDDQIFGDDGNDRLWGQRGDDTLFGGPGIDQFIYREEAALSAPGGAGGEGLIVLTGFGDDVITDFENGPDRLRISTDLAADFASLDITTRGAHVVLDFGTQGTITLLNMAGQFDSADVIFF
ncbi:hypothetical protein ATO11_13540 [Pseudaestuariivita atlantica]|uniref:Calcium-binding protein n=1 Tax=Pseudaestuariivita atlantica TaxID=1317121 RepID=A0A0L1JMI2_9RHOB|nr:hypothetical protein ATO11_13540 [Pseudaestuariivita atlantica]